MTKNILVPLDRSPLSEYALLSDALGVLALARLTRSEITLLTSVFTRSGDSVAGGDHPSDEEVSVASDYLRSIAKRLEELGLHVSTEVVQDSPSTTIVDYAEQNPDVWLIAMGTHRSGPSGSWTHASVPERVLHTTRKPVLLVRPQTDTLPPNHPEGQTGEYQFAIRNIIVPLDGSRRAEEALPYAQRIALSADAILMLVCAIPPRGGGTIDQVELLRLSSDIARGNEAARMARYLNRTADRLRAEGLRVSTEIVYGRPAEMILLAARRLHGDLIVVATRGPQAHERPWLGSVAQTLMQTSTLPLLLVKSSSRSSL